MWQPRVELNCRRASFCYLEALRPSGKGGFCAVFSFHPYLYRVNQPGVPLMPVPQIQSKTGGIRRRRRTAKEHGPDPIDVRVGRQLRLARELTGMTQSDVGAKLGMSFQVVQKYEQGEIRVSASRLFQLARLFNRPVDYFFAGVDIGDVTPPEMERGEIELVRAFRLIQSAELRQCIQRLLREIGEASGTTLHSDNQAIDIK